MKDPLYGNKLASAVLTAVLLIVGLPLLADNFFGEGHHGGGHHGDAHADPFPQYPVEIEVAGGTAPVEEVFDLGAAMAQMEPAQGKRAAAICASCHTFEKGGTHLQGPNLWNIVGRPVGKAEGFNAYSSAMAGFGGVWTYENLDGLIKNSSKFMPGTAMAQKIRKDDKRAQILVYLSSLSDDPVPFPAPLAASADAQTLEDAAHSPSTHDDAPHDDDVPHEDAGH